MNKIQLLSEQEKIKGFLWIRTEIFDNTNLSGPDIMVYATLMRHINNKTKECFPSLKTITNGARLGKATVLNSLRKLEEAKLISRKHINGKVNNYIILEPV